MITTQQAAAFLQAQDRFVLLTHVRPDGDTVGSAAALCRALRDMGKCAYLLDNPEITDTYLPYAAPYWAPKDYVPDTVLAVDVASPSLLCANATPYARRVALCIDHHPSNEHYAAQLCLDASAAACAEVVYDIITACTPLTADIALPLYVGLATDCGGFQYGNTTPRTHRIAAELMALTDVSEINRQLFRTKSRKRLAMESRMVSGMEFFLNGRVVVMQIPLSMCEELQASQSDIEELSALAAQVADTDCGVTLRELPNGVIKISVRSGPRVNACEVCRRLGGGGHFAAAGATVRGSMDEVKVQLLQAIAEVAQ